MQNLPNTKTARRDDAQNPETKTLLCILRRLSAGGTSENDTERIARYLDQEIRQVARQVCRLSHQDRAEISQSVLCEIFDEGTNGSAFRGIAREDDRDLDVIHRLRGRVRHRLRTRSLNRIRDNHRRHEVDASLAANVAVEDPPKPLPEPETLLEALATSPRLQNTDPVDRALLTYMVRHCATARATAKAFGVNHCRVTRAVHRLRPVIREEFEREP